VPRNEHEYRRLLGRLRASTRVSYLVPSFPASQDRPVRSQAKSVVSSNRVLLPSRTGRRVTVMTVNTDYHRRGQKPRVAFAPCGVHVAYRDLSSPAPQSEQPRIPTTFLSPPPGKTTWRAPLGRKETSTTSPQVTAPAHHEADSRERIHLRTREAMAAELIPRFGHPVPGQDWVENRRQRGHRAGIFWRRSGDGVAERFYFRAPAAPGTVASCCGKRARCLRTPRADFALPAARRSGQARLAGHP